MKILFITPSYKPASIYGGTTVAVSKLAESLNKFGTVTVYTTTANGKNDFQTCTDGKLIDGVKVHYFNRLTGDHTHVSIILWWRLFINIKKFDVVHIHSWWSPLILVATGICWLRGVKPVLSPHGMLSPYIFKANHGLSKKIIHNVFGKFLLKRTLLHVSTELELNECREIIPNWNGYVVSNQIELSTRNYSRPKNEIFTIGFLSRIDPKKGLDKLINALTSVNFTFNLKIGGDGDGIYVNELKQLVDKNNMSSKVEWSGWKKDDEKYTFLSSLDLFVLTSHSENFAIVVLEALSVGTPVLISNQVGLSAFVSNNKLGWITNNTPQDIIDKLNDIYLSLHARSQISEISPKLIKECFNQNTIANDYISMYLKIKKKD